MHNPIHVPKSPSLLITLYLQILFFFIFPIRFSLFLCFLLLPSSLTSFLPSYFQSLSFLRNIFPFYYLTILHCPVLFCIVLHCLALSCICSVIFFTILNCPTLSCIGLHYLFTIMRFFGTLPYTVLHFPALSCTILRCSVLFSIVLCKKVHCPAHAPENTVFYRKVHLVVIHCHGGK